MKNKKWNRAQQMAQETDERTTSENAPCTQPSVTAGQSIAIRRDELDWSQEELSWHSGVSTSQIGRIERGESIPSMDTIVRLEEALDMDLYSSFQAQKREQSNSKRDKSRGTNPGEPIYPVSYIRKVAGAEEYNLVEYNEKSSRIGSEEVADFVKRERQRIDAERREKRRKEIAARRREKRRYRRPLPEGVLIPTEYLGIRKMPDVIKTEEYNALNCKLKEYYRAWKKNPNWDGLYRYMQQVDSNQNTDWNEDYSKRVRLHIQSTKNRWDSVSWNTDGCWAQLLTRKGERSVTSDHIKIYASMGNASVSEIFLGVVKILLSRAQNSFAAKVSKYMRKESMCIWVRKADLVLIENYFNGFKDELIENLDFIAYRGKLGYSRETYSGDSHNQWQAELMKGYFKQHTGENELELSDMYQYLIDAWNYEMRKGNRIADSFKNADAQILIILLETFFIIIKNKPFNDDNILLSDDSLVWEPLCRGRNWASVGSHYFWMKEKGKIS